MTTVRHNFISAIAGYNPTGLNNIIDAHVTWILSKFDGSVFDTQNSAFAKNYPDDNVL